MTRIAFIGAGSVVFARTLLGDVLSYPALSDATIALMDVDAERLDRTAAVARATVDDNDLDATIEATTDRRAALEGADYVFTMIHVGGREPFENEVRIPREHGVHQAVGDTLGPGGVFRAARTIPDMLDIARDMEELCPDAPLLNYTNPMAMLCWAIDEATDVDVYGLCHSVQGTARTLAEYVGVPPGEVEYWVAGINHLAWFLSFERGGEDLYPALREAMADPAVYADDTVRFEMLRHFGAFPTESSHHVSEYVPYFRATEADVAAVVDRSSGEARTKWMPTGEYLRHWLDYQAENAGRAPGDFDTAIERSEEYGARIVHSMETGEPRRMNLNVRNDAGAISNLPADACVEVPCLVDGQGIHPCTVGDLPPQLAALDRSNVAVQELGVRAALDGDEAALRRAIKLDPLTGAALTLDGIDAMVDDLLEANAEYLPEGLG